MRGIERINPDALRRRRSSRLARRARAITGAPGPSLGLDASSPPRDEAVFWLTVAAEIEHALMVQYLYAAYSLNPAVAGARAGDVEKAKQELLQIAREEMGHLVTVENLLLLVGAPLHLGREHSPYGSQVYPFRFRLERLTLDSLAKYVVAESPDVPPDEIPGLTDEDRRLLATEIEQRARRGNDDVEIRNVGPIYHRLRHIFSQRLDDADFRLDRAAYQARWSDWGFEASRGTSGLEVLVHSFGHDDAPSARAAAVTAIEAIGMQGEASDMAVDTTESHFERFLAIFKLMKGLEAELGREPVWPVARDPNTSRAPAEETPAPQNVVEAAMERRVEEGRITVPRTRAWAELLNLRYRLLLQCLLHAFHRADAPYAADGDRSPKGLLQWWAFSEMRHIKKIAEKLVQMRKDAADGSLNAGPPFELPVTLGLSQFEADRWRMHADALAASMAVVVGLRAGPDASDPFLAALADSDGQALRAALAIAAGEPAAPALTGGYGKTLAALDEAVRGFDIGRHGAFWRGLDRDQLVASEVAGGPVIVPGDPGHSPLLERIGLPDSDRRRMPRYRPRMPQERIDHVRAWIAAGAPDDVPAGFRLAGEPSPLPEPAGPVTAAPGFASDIRVLFRASDRNAMLAYSLDLHDYQQVKEKADLILEYLEDGSMPCDGAWPAERIALFRAWRDRGCQP